MLGLHGCGCAQRACRMNSPDPARPFLGRYEIADELGRGGMAVVYRVLDPVSGRFLAAKQLLMQRDALFLNEARVRFEREFHTLCGLSHPRIIELTEEEMEQLARSAAPVLRLRGNWTVIDPSITRKARKRVVRTATPAEAIAAALTGVVQLGTVEEPVEEQVQLGASLLHVRERLLNAARQEPVEVPVALQGTLRDYQRQGLTWLAELTSHGLGACLADDMGLGKTVTLIALHLHRGGGPTLVVCPASLLGNWEAEIARFAPGVPVRRHHGSRRDLDDVEGFVLTTYGTMRVDHAALAQVPWDLVVADEAQHVKNARSSTARALRTIPGRARVALTGTPVENNLTELWAPFFNTASEP